MYLGIVILNKNTENKLSVCVCIYVFVVDGGNEFLLNTNVFSTFSLKVKTRFQLQTNFVIHIL